MNFRRCTTTPRPPAGSDRIRQHSRERGVTAVEYALLIAALLVPLVLGVQAVQANGGSRLDRSGHRIGTPTESFVPNTPTTGVIVAPSSTSEPPAQTTTVTGATLQGNATPQSGKWTATVIITLVDQNGQPIAGAGISGTWAIDGGGAQQATTCTTDTGGRCTVTQWNLKRSGEVIHLSTSFTLGNITGTSLTIGPGVTGTSVTVQKP